MHEEYEDIRALGRAAGREPLWFTEDGVPRFDTHHPKHCPDVYADQVALLRISCQSCAKEFRVQMSSNSMSSRAIIAVGSHGRPIQLAEELYTLASALDQHEVHRDTLAKLGAEIDAIRARKPKALADVVRDGSIHFGDPPRHDNCGAGDTMNCWDLEVIEFWRFSNDVGFEWTRDPQLERMLPDVKDPER